MMPQPARPGFPPQGGAPAAPPGPPMGGAPAMAPAGPPGAPPGGIPGGFKQPQMSPEEWAEFDSYITPRFVELIGKAFGPQAAQALMPYMSKDPLQDSDDAYGTDEFPEGGNEALQDPTEQGGGYQPPQGRPAIGNMFPR
jgi:hypothetical protein